jgi:hypothetical protein
VANFVFNVARGRLRYYYDAVDSSIVLASAGAYTSAADSALIIVAIDAAGTTDDALADFADLGALLGGTPNEATNTGYARKVIDDTGLTASAEDDTNNRLDLDAPDQIWTGVAAGTNWTDLLICFRPTALAADSAIIPLTCHDFVRTPNGSDITASMPAPGFYRSS